MHNVIARDIPRPAVRPQVEIILVSFARSGTTELFGFVLRVVNQHNKCNDKILKVVGADNRHGGGGVISRTSPYFAPAVPSKFAPPPAKKKTIISSIRIIPARLGEELSSVPKNFCLRSVLGEEILHPVQISAARGHRVACHVGVLLIYCVFIEKSKLF